MRDGIEVRGRMCIGLGMRERVTIEGFLSCGRKSI